MMKKITLLFAGQSTPMQFIGVQQEEADEFAQAYISGSRNRIEVGEWNMATCIVDLGAVVSVTIEDDPENEATFK